MKKKNMVYKAWLPTHCVTSISISDNSIPDKVSENVSIFCNGRYAHR